MLIELLHSKQPFEILFQALCGGRISIPTLSGKTVTLQLRDTIKPNSNKRIAGEGLPFPKNSSLRGDMIVEFNIIFPERLNESQKTALATILPSLPT